MNDHLDIKVCPGTLAEGFNSYSPKCIKEMFNGIKVSHILPFPSPQKEGAQKKIFLENRSRISISGVQEKYSLTLNKETKTFELTEKRGAYILKPIPVDLLNVKEVPANEHLTMQIATQVYKIPTARCAMIFFEDGIPAYITQRFDLKTDGSHCLKEDFASIAGLTSENAGKDFKYAFSYEGIARLIDRFIPANIPAKENFFRLVVFNYLFSNGDAHLKNFSRIDCSGEGDAFLSPAYDLVNTRLHIDDSDLRLREGLYEQDYTAPSYSTFGYYAFDDFYEFGKRIGLVPARVKRMILGFLTQPDKVQSLTERSFLNCDMKKLYLEMYFEKRKRLSTSLQGLIGS